MNENSVKYKKIAKNIKKYRNGLGLTQEELAKKMNMSRSYLSKIEASNVKKSFSIEILFSLSEALGISESKLLDFDSDDE